MAYTDFSLDLIEQKFGIKNKVKKLFHNIKPLEPDSWLIESLKKSENFTLRTEKAKSEFIVAPILAEIKSINNEYCNIYSGEILDSDRDNGLYGECDFLITKNTDSFNIKAPLLVVVEAKKHDIDSGIVQCSAQLVGIQKFNEKYKSDEKYVYGVVTIATEWKFLKLENNIITIDSDIYYLNKLEEILGIFQFIIDSYKKK